MISHEHRCIFVHIPKTAGNSINRVFGVGWEDHKDLQSYSEELPCDVFTAYFKFAVVRNPWDRLLSDYNYQLKKSRAPASKLFVVDADGSKRNFAEWIEVALGEPNRYKASDWGGAVSPHIHRWSPQIDWISINGDQRTNFVARLERLPEDFRAICRRLDLPPVRLPHRNRRLHLHYSHYYNRTTRELVAAYYARDIEHFGYEFEHAFFCVAVNWPGARRAAESAPQRSTDSPELADATVRACKVSFATARPPAFRRIWQRRPGLTAIASLALVLGSFSLSSLAMPLTAEDVFAPPASEQLFVRRIILRSSATPSGDAAANFFVRARRFSRLMSEHNLSLELVPAVAPGAILSLSLEPTGAPRSYARSVAPVRNRSGSGPAPRWWWHHSNQAADD